MPRPVPARRYTVPAVTRPGGRRLEDDAFEDLLDAFTRRLVHTQGRSPATANTYSRHIRAAYRRLAAVHPALAGADRLAAATTAQLEDFLADEGARGVAASTRHTAVHALRSLYTYLVERRGLAANPAASLKGPKTPRRRPDYYTETEALQLLEYAARQAEHDQRRAVGYVAMVVFFCTGIRLGELAGLRLDQVHLDERRLVVDGKGNKRRDVPIDVTGAAVLAWYLEQIRPRLKAAGGSDYLFVNPKSHTTGPKHGRFAAQSLEQLVTAFGQGAGLPGRHFPHRLRHTFASLAIARGMSAFTLQGILGHANITTTEIYVHLASGDRAAEHDRIFGRRPLPLPPAVAEQPGVYAAVPRTVRLARLLARQAAADLRRGHLGADAIRQAAEACATPPGRPLIPTALTAVLETGAKLHPDFPGLLAEHGEPLLDALSAIGEAAERCCSDDDT